MYIITDGNLKDIKDQINMPSMFLKVLELDGERFTLHEFIQTNLFDATIGHIKIEEAIQIINLSVGGFIDIPSGCGWTNVKRII